MPSASSATPGARSLASHVHQRDLPPHGLGDVGHAELREKQRRPRAEAVHERRRTRSAPRPPAASAGTRCAVEDLAQHARSVGRRAAADAHHIERRDAAQAAAARPRRAPCARPSRSRGRGRRTPSARASRRNQARTAFGFTSPSRGEKVAPTSASRRAIEQREALRAPRRARAARRRGRPGSGARASRAPSRSSAASS